MDLRLLGAVPLLIASGAIGNPSPPDGHPPSVPDPAVAGRPAPTDARPRLRVFVDPRTGRWWRPGTSQATPPQGAKAFEVLLHPDGTRSVDLQDVFTVNLVVRRNRDGSMSFACVPGLAAQGTSPPPASAAEPVGGPK